MATGKKQTRTTNTVAHTVIGSRLCRRRERGVDIWWEIAIALYTAKMPGKTSLAARMLQPPQFLPRLADTCYYDVFYYFEADKSHLRLVSLRPFLRFWLARTTRFSGCENRACDEFVPTEATMIETNRQPDWRDNGVRVVRAENLDTNTPQTPGMNRAAAINYARVGAQKLWAGTVTIHPNAKTGAHHHGALESVIYVLRGRARMRWGNQLEYVAEAGPGDFIYVPPYVPHQEINASAQEPLECVLVRSDNEAVVINLDIAAVETPQEVRWVDPIHEHPHN
jgi:uncharacterized RmlC-like cupin family protein